MKTKPELENKVKMISSVAETLKFKRTNSKLDNEQTLKHIFQFVSTEKCEDAKLMMIAASSRALSILDKSPFLADKDVIRKVMDDFPEILGNIQN